MSLQTDIIFVKALKSNSELMAELPAHDIYNPGIVIPKDGKDNTKLPYVIVCYSGMVNDSDTKDELEGETDQVQIKVEIAAKNREQLASIAVAVRNTIRDYFRAADPEDEDYNLIPNDYVPSASAVILDDVKPCVWQVLNYACDTNVD